MLNVLVISILLLIFIQDIRSRSVYWFLFPLLTIGLLAIRLMEQPFDGIWPSVLINIGFLIIQLIVLTLYFSIKNKEWVMVTRNLLGWGDVLFLLSIAFYMSLLNYLFFYIITLSLILVFWTIYNSVKKNKVAYIPLAGLQALIFAVLLAGNWWCRCFDLTNDAGLLRLITK